MQTKYLLFGGDKISIGCYGAEDSFFCSNSTTGVVSNGDIYIELTANGLRVSPNVMWFSGGSASRYIDETIPGDGWAWPYHADIICAGGRCEASLPFPQIQSPYFVMPANSILVYGDAMAKVLSAPLSLRDGGLFKWDESWLKLKFKPSATLQVQSSDAQITGVELGADDENVGWGGILVNNSAHLTLGQGAKVSHVGSGNQPAGIVVWPNGTLIVDGATIENTAGGYGIAAFGNGATVSVRGSTTIQGNGLAGIGVGEWATATVDGAGVTVSDNGGGIKAEGTGARAVVLGGNLLDNLGPAFLASTGARIDVLRETVGGTPSAPVLVSHPKTIADNNAGGLYASGASVLQSGGLVTSGDWGLCKKEPCPNGGGQEITRNNLGPSYDALASAGGIVMGILNYWGNRPLAAIETHLVGASSLIYIDPIISSPPSSNGPSSGGPTLKSDDAGSTRPPSAVLSRKLEPLLRSAEGYADAREEERAASEIIRAFASAESASDLLAVSESAVRVMVSARPDVLVRWAQDASGISDRVRPWARRVLAAGLLAQNMPREALQIAQSLADEDGAGETVTAWGHRARGLSFQIEAAIMASMPDVAIVALQQLAAFDREGSVQLAFSVALAFPDTPVNLAPEAELKAGSDGSTQGRIVAVPSLAAFPNPVIHTLTVRIPETGGAVVRVEVLDVLGRTVAILHDSFSDGVLDLTWDARSLAVGSYVVRAVSTDDTGPRVWAKSILVAR